MTHAERIELAVRDGRVFWHRHGNKPRRIFLTFPEVRRGPGRKLHAVSRPLTSTERRALHRLDVRYMRRRDDAPGVSRGVVLMAE